MEIQSAKTNNRALVAGCLAHITQDGITDMLYVFFPIWQNQLSLSLTQIGLIKTLYSGSMALFQFPAGLVAARFGEMLPLIVGTMLTGFAVISFGGSSSFFILCILMAFGGLGASFQHPLASSLISGAYPENKKRRVALSTYNMSGDLGKLLLPGLAALVIAGSGWRTAARIFGCFGIFAAVALSLIQPKNTAKKDVLTHTRVRGLSGWQKNKAFWVLAAVGIIDSATRTGFLTFFPFLLQTKGADIRLTGLAYTLVFAGGVAGKFLCGVLAAGIGALRTIVATEIIMAALIISTVGLPLKGALLLAPVIGTFLNGTSSVLYGSVPQILTGDQEQQGFAAFYTAAIGAGALSPFFYGMMSGYTGVPGTIWVIAAISAAAIPFAFYLRPYLD